jgi:hypothetical protein
MQVRHGMRREHFRNPEPGFGCHSPWSRNPRQWYSRRRKFRTTEEQTGLLEKKKAFLEKALEGVKERLVELQKEPEEETNDNQA